MIERLPLYKLHIPILPMNYTLGLTYKCNSRCKTCRVYEREPVEEMLPTEWLRIFKQLGKSPYWITFTGGEPFLYKDLPEVYYDLTETCNPKLINIPTNGLLTERIVDWVWQMTKASPHTKLTVNVSIDALSSLNDEIRGISGAYDRAVETVKKLQELHLDNLDVGVHTVISTFNIADFTHIQHELSALVRPGLYITEIAELRNELANRDIEITPRPDQYLCVFDSIKTSNTWKGILRSRYYYMTAKWLYTHQQEFPCYAGYASCQITPNGDVWFCCTLAISIGNLREKDFRTIWQGKEATNLRKDTKCTCPLANASYTNMILSPWRLF